MAFSMRIDGGLVAAASCVLLLACGDDGGSGTGDGTGPGDSTGRVTTFEPTTTIDPTDPTLTGSTGPGDGSTGTSDDASTGSSGAPTSSSSEGAVEESSSSGGEAAPVVMSTIPADLSSGVVPDTAVEIGFSTVMDPGTLTTNLAGDDTCSGSVQLSRDGFTTCVPMGAAPSSGDDQTFSVTPAAPLESRTTYQLRVLDTVATPGGQTMEADFTTPTGFIVRYFHTITIDGVDDFTADETFATSTVGHTGRVAWDADFLYLGVDSPDVAAGSNQVWLVAYVGGPAGTAQGVTYNTQSPAMPFDARWHLRWRADGSFTEGMEWTGAAWNGGAIAIPNADWATSGTFVELRVPLTELGDPAYLDLHVGLLREEAFNEASWAAVPEGSYVDGYDPDYGQFLQFDLAGSTAPVDTPPM